MNRNITFPIVLYHWIIAEYIDEGKLLCDARTIS
jgi:hypothetical protein